MAGRQCQPPPPSLGDAEIFTQFEQNQSHTRTLPSGRNSTTRSMLCLWNPRHLFAFPDKLWANVRSMRSRSGARCPGDAAMPSEVLRELILKLTEPDRLEIIRAGGGRYRWH